MEDRAYFDFTLIPHRIQGNNVFVPWINTNTLYQSIQELGLPDDRDIIKYKIVVLNSNKVMETGHNEQKQRLYGTQTVFSIFTKTSDSYVIDKKQNTKIRNNHIHQFARIVS